MCSDVYGQNLQTEITQVVTSPPIPIGFPKWSLTYSASADPPKPWEVVIGAILYIRKMRSQNRENGEDKYLLSICLMSGILHSMPLNPKLAASKVPAVQKSRLGLREVK